MRTYQMEEPTPPTKPNMPSRSRNHHYVPQVLQRQFLAKNQCIWFSERGDDGKYCAPYLKNIAKAFFRKDHYTIDINDKPSDIVETDFYGSIDNYLGQLLPQITRYLNSGIPPLFESGALTGLRQTVIAMAKRTPEFTDKFDDQTIGLEFADTLLTALPEHSGIERTHILKTLSDKNSLKKTGRTIRVRATIAPSDKVDTVLEEFSARFVISSSRHSYIISSLLAYIIGNGGPNGLSNPKAEIWMPISPKHVLVLIRDPDNRIPIISEDTTDHIRQVNEFSAHNSKQIASHSQQLLESITGKKAKRNQH